MVSNEADADGKVRGLNGLAQGESKTGKRHFWHRCVLGMVCRYEGGGSMRGWTDGSID